MYVSDVEDCVDQYNFATWRVTVTHTVTVTVVGSKVLMVLKVLEVLTYQEPSMPDLQELPRSDLQDTKMRPSPS